MQKQLNLMRYYPVYFGLSLLVIVPGLASLLVYGLKPGIDFTGGTLVALTPPNGIELTQSLVEAALPEGIQLDRIDQDGALYTIRTSHMTPEQSDMFQYTLASSSGLLEASDSGVLAESRFESIGPTLGKELLQKTLVSILLASTAILLYVASRFSELKYGVSAVIAMFHDTFILLGVFSLLGHFAGIEVDTLFVTAVLTTLSFSVHDTIVVYDRIREQLASSRKQSFEHVVNESVVQTLSRSINNSMTIIFMLLALWLLGGETIKWFVFALLIGTIAGTYSSTFTAAPILLVWERYVKKKRH